MNYDGEGQRAKDSTTLAGLMYDSSSELLQRGRHCMDWNTLTEIYEKDGLALVLGAGISYDSNIPSWDHLLEEMVKKYVKHGGRRLYARL
ncbi:MAG: hypothetical protein MUO77_06720, partial [Anaerolineales bacterium]|nr:hypothetical protein [Anaerolineales bacterium]